MTHYNRSDAKRLREQTSILTCIYQELMDVRSFSNQSDATMAVVFLLDKCTEDLNQTFKLSYFHIPENSRTINDMGTILHLAVIKNLPPLVDALLERGMDGYAVTKDNQTLFDLAMFSNSRFFPEMNNKARVSMVNLLLDWNLTPRFEHVAEVIYNRKADIWIFPVVEKMIRRLPESELNCVWLVDLADENTHKNDWAYLKKDWLNLVQLAVAVGHNNALRVLLERGVRYNHITENFSLNIYDCMCLPDFKHKRILPTLEIIMPLKVKVDVEIKRDRAPILFECFKHWYQCMEIIELLLQAGADPNRCFQGRCLLEMTNDKSLRLLLLRYGADPNIEPRKNYSLLFDSNFTEEDDLLFFYHGADVNAWKYNGTSYLHHHFLKGNKQIVCKVIESWLLKK